MYRVRKLQYYMVLVIACLTAPLVQADNYFSVSGPLDIYVDLLTGEKIYNYSYSAKLTYQPATETAEIYRYSHMEQVFYYDTILSIEYSIYDAQGNIVNNGVERGNLNNITSAIDDIDFTDTINEQMYWYGDDPLALVKTQAGISFYDASGEIVKSVEQYPSPPELDEVDYGGSSFYQFNQNSGTGFDAWGPVTEISFDDPFINCSRSSSNRRQYILCAARVFFSLRKDERLELFKDLLEQQKIKTNRWESYVQCSGGERKLSTFNRCFGKTVKALYKEKPEKRVEKKQKEKKGYSLSFKKNDRQEANKYRRKTRKNR